MRHEFENKVRQPWMTRLIDPARSHCIPHARAWKIALRTAHLMATSLLLGGHAFGAPTGELRRLLYVTIGTGVGLIILEAYPSLHFLVEGWGLLLLGKLALLCVIPFAWGSRIPLLLAVVALASIGSHMPSRFRHWSLLCRKEIS